MTEITDIKAKPDTVRVGIYRHYKGQYYQVIGLAQHSETEENLVVYRALYGSYGLWVRPLKNFMDYVEVSDKLTPRFQWVAPD